MLEINKFSYNQNGITILFTACEITEEEPLQKYSFSVEDDEQLTQKLINSVKNKTVLFESIYYCAQALFEIIRTGSFGSIVTGEEIASLFEKFQKMFGETPKFGIIDLSTKKMPLWTAYLTNAYVSVVGTGRTIQNAQAEALENCFIRYQET